MSEHYVPPPPPYELSLQRDQKVTEELAAQALEVSKGHNPFRDKEWNDSKHARSFSDKTLRDVAMHALPKRSASSDNLRLRAPRPLPPSPADARPLCPPGQGSKLRPISEIKTDVAQSDHETEPYSPVPPLFSAIGHTPDEPPYPQNMLHPSASVHTFPMHYPSQPSYDAPRRKYDDRWPVSAQPPMESCAGSSSRYSLSIPFQSPSYSLPQNKNLGTRLAFDPSVAYSGSQASTRTAFSTPRRVEVSLYSSAVSPHLSLDSPTISGSRQSYVPARPARWSAAETPLLDNTDVWSVRSSLVSPSSSTTSLCTPRPRTSSGYEQRRRWASSEADITRDLHRD